MNSVFKKIAKNSAIYSLGNISSKLVGFILLPVYTKFLTINDYGVLAILEISGQFLSAVLGLGLYFALNRWYWDADYQEKQSILFFNVLATIGLFSFLILTVMFMQAGALAQILFDSIKFTYYIKLLLIATFFNSISRATLNLMRIQERAALYAVANFVRFTVNLVFTIYFVVFLGRNVAGIYEAQILGFIVFFLIIAKYLLQNIKIKLDYPLIREMLIFGIPMILTSISGIILSITDRYSLRFLSDMGQVGIYSFGFKISNILKVFLGQSIIWALTPIMYKVMKDASARAFYSKVLNYFAFILTLMVLGLSLFAREVIELIAQDKDYYLAYQVVPIIAYAILFDLLKNVSAIGINIARKTKTTAFIITFVALLNIGLNILLIPYYQAIGAAIATLISQLIAFILISKFGQKYFNIPYEYQKIFILLIISAIFYSITLFFKGFSFWQIIFVKTFLFTFYPLTLILLRIIDLKNMALFKRNLFNSES